MGGQWNQTARKYMLLASKIIMPEANFKHCSVRNFMLFSLDRSVTKKQILNTKYQPKFFVVISLPLLF